jgi:hypothetical protein
VYFAAYGFAPDGRVFRGERNDRLVPDGTWLATASDDTGTVMPAMSAAMTTIPGWLRLRW